MNKNNDTDMPLTQRHDASRVGIKDHQILVDGMNAVFMTANSLNIINPNFANTNIQEGIVNNNTRYSINRKATK